MGVLSNMVDREELKPGDHIYSWRTAYIYAHHGIYIGDGMVIHYTRAAGQEMGTGTFLDGVLFSSSSPANTGTVCERCGDQSKLHGVLCSCLDCFLSGGNLYVFHYAVSPAFFLAKARGGTCTLAPSDPFEDVLHRAKYLLNNGFGAYCLFKNNCEDFAIYCKTGLLLVTSFGVGRSGQLASLTAAFSAVVSSPLRFLTTSFAGLSVVVSGMYCVGRYVSDMGIRRDVVKIAVESLVAESAARRPESVAAELAAGRTLVTAESESLVAAGRTMVTAGRTMVTAESESLVAAGRTLVTAESESLVAAGRTMVTAESESLVAAGRTMVTAGRTLVTAESESLVAAGRTMVTAGRTLVTAESESLVAAGRTLVTAESGCKGGLRV